MKKKWHGKKVMISSLILALSNLSAFALIKPPEPEKELIKFESVDKLQSSWEDRISLEHPEITKQWSVSMIKLGERDVIKMTYDFSGNKLGRAVYQKKVKLDLSEVSTIEMDVMASNPATLKNGMSIMFKSGNGWYSNSVLPKGKMEWTKIRISRCGFREYGQTEGWKNITAVRFVPWAMAREPGEIYVANFGFMPPNCKIAILNQTFKNKKASVGHLVNMVIYAENLMDSGIIPLPVSSLDFDKKPLSKEWTIFLPAMPQIRKETVARLCEHINNGGKIVAVSAIPPDVAKCLGVKLNEYKGDKGRGDLIVSKNIFPIIPKEIPERDSLLAVPEATSKDGLIFARWRSLESEKTYPGAFICSKGAYIPIRARFRRNQTSLLLLGVLSQFDKSIIKNAADCYLKGPGWSFDCNWDDALKEIAKLPNYPKVEKDCKRVQLILSDARQSVKNGKYSEAINTFAKASFLLKKAYINAWQMPDFEFFATSVRDSMPMDKLIPFLKACNVTDITIKIGSGASSAYSNSIKPQWKKYITAEDKDFIVKRIKAFADANIKVWSERQNLVSSKRDLTSEEFARLKKENRLAVSSNGKIIEGWLCPTHPDIIKEQCALMLECADIPGVHGVCFDLIRYSTVPTACFCPRCKQLFERHIKGKVNWNRDVAGKEQYHKKWLQFKADNITNIVKAASETVRKAKPEIKIMAFVFSSYPTCKYENGQDWKLWIEKGYIDKAGPMDYITTTNGFRQLVKAQGKLLGGCEKLYPGIGLTERLSSIEAMRQITVAKEAGAKGVYLFAFWGPYVRTVFASLREAINK